MLQHFVLLPTFLILELSSNCIDQMFFPLTMDVLGQHYVPNCTPVIDVPVIILQWRLKMTLAGCILMMCVLVRSYTTFQDLLHSHPYGCFFAIFNIADLEFITICKQCEIYMKSIFLLQL